jgi:hypothetical protein
MHDTGPKKSLDFPGWGTTEQFDDLDRGPVQIRSMDSAPGHEPGQWKSTALCGNDITSSCLYVASLCTISAGPFAPLALLGPIHTLLDIQPLRSLRERQQFQIAPENPTRERY